MTYYYEVIAFLLKMWLYTSSKAKMHTGLFSQMILFLFIFIAITWAQ